jgi:PhnB protein
MPAIHEGFPYLIVRGADEAIEFYRTVFGAELRLRMPDSDGRRVGHAELALGPMIIMLADEYPELGIQGPLAFGGSGLRLHLHVDDVDALARSAAGAGATILMEPADQEHGERQCRLRDPFGHEWLLGQPSGRLPAAKAASDPAGLYPCLRYRDEAAAMEWLERTFGLERQTVVAAEDGTIVHAELRLGSGVLMLGSAPEDAQGFSVYAWVEDLETHYARARAAGAEIVRPLADTDYGTREYGARDLDGHLWFFGTYRPPGP